MSIETVAANTIEDFEDVIGSDVIENDPRVRLHGDIAILSKTLHELELQHRVATLGLIALRDPTHITSSESDVYAALRMAHMRLDLTGRIEKMREEYLNLMAEITATNQTIIRPYEPKEREEAERPYVVQIYNDGIDPSKMDLYDRYLTVAAE